MKRKSRLILALCGVVALLLGAGYLYSRHRINEFRKNNVPKPGAVEVGDLAEIDFQPFLAYLDSQGEPPEEYVVGKFKDHDLIILGEIHEVREVCRFIGDLMKPLYHQAGVRCFAMEVLKHQNDALANELVTGESFDDQSALRLFRDCAWPIWGFQEYMDILKSVWEVNRKLPPGAEKLRIIGLSNDLDMYDLFCGPLWTRVDDFIKMARSDNYMAGVIGREVLDRGVKALVQIGYNHSFTRYRQPAVVKGKLLGEAPPRFGHILYSEYGDRIFQVCLHQPHFGPGLVSGSVSRCPVLGGLMEKVMDLRGNRPVGFDVAGSPFAMLRDPESYFFAFQNYAVFSDIAQGYVFLKPLDQLSKVTWARGFIDQSNFEKARAILLKKVEIADKPEIESCRTPEELDSLLSKNY